LKSFLIRFLNLIIGLFLYSLGIVTTIRANIGYAPWDVFQVGISNKTGFSLGLVSIMVGVTLVVVVTLLKEKLGLGTVCNMILIGVFIDLIYPNIPIAKDFIIGAGMLLLGLFIVALGSYFYIKSAFGVGPRDNLMVVLKRKTKLPVGVCRFIIELLVTIAGWFLGGMVGIGTVISVIAIGFCIQIVFKVLKFDVTGVKHETLAETYVVLRKEIRGQ